MLAYYYGFKLEPFRLTPDPQFAFPSPTQVEVYGRLFSGVHGRKGVLVLSGASGTGKTFLLRKLEEELSASGCTTFFFCNPVGTFDDLLMSCCERLGLSRRVIGQSEVEGVLVDFLSRKTGIVACLMDEAHLLSDDLLGKVVNWRDLLAERGVQAQLVLAGKPSLMLMLRRLGVERMVSEHCKLSPLPSQEVGLFINHQLHKAGYGGQALFSPEAVEKIAQHSRGVPRTINGLCRAALVNASLRAISQIDADIVDEVLQDQSEGGNPAFALLDETDQIEVPPPHRPGAHGEADEDAPAEWPDTGDEPRKPAARTRYLVFGLLGVVVLSLGLVFHNVRQHSLPASAQNPDTSGASVPEAGVATAKRAVPPPRGAPAPPRWTESNARVAPAQTPRARAPEVVPQQTMLPERYASERTDRAPEEKAQGVAGRKRPLPAPWDAESQTPVQKDTPHAQRDAAQEAQVGTTSPQSAQSGSAPEPATEAAAVPALQAQDAVGDEDTPIPLHLSIAATDRVPLAVKVLGVPAHARLTAGTERSGAWLVPRSDLAGLAFVPSRNSDGEIHLTAALLDMEQHRELMRAPMLVTVRAVADKPVLSVSAAAGDQYTAIPVEIHTSLTDNDGSETLTIQLTGVPDGVALSAGREIAPHTWELTPAELHGLILTPMQYAPRVINLTVNAIATERSNGDRAVASITTRINVIPAPAPD